MTHRRVSESHGRGSRYNRQKSTKCTEVQKAAGDMHCSYEKRNNKQQEQGRRWYAGDTEKENVQAGAEKERKGGEGYARSGDTTVHAHSSLKKGPLLSCEQTLAVPLRGYGIQQSLNDLRKMKNFLSANVGTTWDRAQDGRIHIIGQSYTKSHTTRELSRGSSKTAFFDDVRRCGKSPLSLPLLSCVTATCVRSMPNS